MTSRPRRRSLPGWVRWLHVYISLIGFAALLFFAVTGLTLNHAEFFEGGGEVSRKESGELDLAWVSADLLSERVDKLRIAETLRARHHLRGMVHEFAADEFECLVVFKGPGYTADVTIDRQNGTYSVYETSKGAVAVLDDLHKGRHSGGPWSWLIDVSAVLMVLTSLTGFWLLFYVKRWRRSGLIVAGVGTAIVVVLYVAGVP